ncbi:MAG: winged helix-turn-helix domain-containing protein [Candidatus Gracilibacteria bacterium]
MIRAIAKTKSLQGLNVSDSFISTILKMDERIKETENGFGLLAWRHVNPRSIRDKALIVLKKEKKPLHFVDIAKKIVEYHFDEKRVTIQAVHNELIRYPNFVLVGRGLYALKEWGYQDGTVTDIIEMLLKHKSPLSKQDIIKGVLKQRRVKKGTISLNLQKNPQFVRVGRAVYAFDESKKIKA